MDTKSDRLKETVASLKFHFKLKQRDIAAAVGTTPSYLSDMMNGGTDVSESFVDRLCSAYPSVNRNFILSGNGEAFVSHESKDCFEPSASSDISIPAEAWAVIRQQAASLERKDAEMERFLSSLERKDQELERRDAQQDALIEMLRESFSMLKGAAVPGAAISAAADGSAG